MRYLLPFLAWFSWAAEQPFYNLDFEHTWQSGRVRYWNSRSGVFDFDTDSETVYTGKHSLRVTFRGEELGNRFGVLSHSLPTENLGGKKVLLTGYIKTEGVDQGYAGLWCRADADSMKLDNMSDRGAKGTGDWKQYRIEMDVPQGVKGFFFGIIMPGTGKAWFDKLELFVDGKPIPQVDPEPELPKKEEIAWLKANAVPFDTAQPIDSNKDLMPLKAMVGDARIVALGEATHGTSEFFSMKHRIVKFLAEEMDFTLFAIEANMPEARKVDHYVMTGEGDPREALSGLYFWTWDTTEVLAMIEWMRAYNASGKGVIRFYGFDMQFPQGALENLKTFVREKDTEYLPQLEHIHKTIMDEYDQRRKQNNYGPWKKETIQQVDTLIQHFEGLAIREGLTKAERAWAVQDARVLRQCVSNTFGNMAHRDRSMADNLEWILEHSPPGSKVVTWAHNGHVSRKSPRYESMGSFLTERRDDMFVMGFGFHEGTYIARGPKGLTEYGTLPSEPGTAEWYFKQTGMPRIILDMRPARRNAPNGAWLNRALPFHTIGAMAAEDGFVPTKLAEEFDALIYFEKTGPSGCFRKGEN